ncbi:MAG: TraR/DksA C4-type zinc finger protein [Pirellulales bacterium]
MAQDDRWIQLRCSGCGWGVVHDAAGAARWLRAAGRLRENSDADSETIRELLLALAPSQACPECGAKRLSASPAEDEQFGWPQAATCEVCQQVIAAERLAVFPNATLCAACQEREEQGAPPPTGEFCPRCGAPLAVRLAERGGVRRYRLACTGNPPCRSM